MTKKLELGLLRRRWAVERKVFFGPVEGTSNWAEQEVVLLETQKAGCSVF